MNNMTKTSLVALTLSGIFIACSGSAPTDLFDSPTAPPSKDAGSKTDSGFDAGQVEELDSSTVCVPESDNNFCGRMAANCGAAMGSDNCDNPRTVANCGTCQKPEECNAGNCSTKPCVPATEKSLCKTASKDCGSIKLVDNCGVQRTLDCGDDKCAGKKNTSCTDNKCTTCVGKTDTVICKESNKDCGTLAPLTDNCGETRTVVCGPTNCGKGFNCTANKCTACTPKVCAANMCGKMSDGCTTSALVCPDCDAGYDCIFNTCKAHCTPNTDSAVCMAAGYQCGPLDTVDNCGNPRHIAECGINPNKCDGLCMEDHKCCVPTTKGLACKDYTCGDVPSGCGFPYTCGPNAGGCSLGNHCELSPGTNAGYCIPQKFLIRDKF